MTSVSSRTRAALVVALTTALLVAPTGVSWAGNRIDDGEIPGPPLSTPVWLGLYIAIPAAIIAVVWIAVYAPSMLRKPRYRPTRGWEHGALWFAGPENPAQAVEAATEPEGTRGGAHGSW